MFYSFYTSKWWFLFWEILQHRQYHDSIMALPFLRFKVKLGSKKWKTNQTLKRMTIPSYEFEKTRSYVFSGKQFQSFK